MNINNVGYAGNGGASAKINRSCYRFLLVGTPQGLQGQKICCSKIMKIPVCIVMGTQMTRIRRISTDCWPEDLANVPDFHPLLSAHSRSHCTCITQGQLPTKRAGSRTREPARFFSLLRAEKPFWHNRPTRYNQFQSHGSRSRCWCAQYRSSEHR